MKISILGSGSWGTALAIALAARADSIHIWGRDLSVFEGRRNARYLPGFTLPPNVHLTERPEPCHLTLVAVPSRAFRQVCTHHLPPSGHVLVATKGIEYPSLLRMSEIVEEVAPGRSVAILSGPSFARDVASGQPTALVIAAHHLEHARQLQSMLATRNLRFYATDDPVGVELGAAAKNVIAIGAGICVGLGLGSNTIAALITRGLAEITRLALGLGGSPRTLSGLAGLGDLVLTATGDLSRNRFVGVELGRGRALPEILGSMTGVAEGIETCRAAHVLAQRASIELPIVHQMFQVLYDSKPARLAIEELMERPLTVE